MMRTEGPSPKANKISCTGCRAVKCRCISDGDTTQKCRRCVRLDLECVFLPHQRGRRKGALSRRPSGAVQGNPDVTGQASAPPSPTPASNTDNDKHNEDDGAKEKRLGAPASSVYHAVADRTTFSIAGVMERNKTTPTYSGSSPRSVVSFQNDPVSIRLLSMDEADSLFHHYHEHLQTCVCQLDPAIHNAEYTRSQSLQLFTAVLAVSAKFFRPELYERLLDMANSLVGQAIYANIYAIEIVQAICLLHYWKKPIDSSGWLRLGHAIRLAYQLDLHLPRRQDFDDNERQARFQIDRERTWISLFCFDSTMTELSDRPSMMHKVPDVAGWLRSIPYPLPSDGQLEFAVKTSVLSSEVRQLQQCRAEFPLIRSGLKRISDELDRSYDALTSPDSPVQLTTTSRSILKFSRLAQQLLIECTLLSFAPRAKRIGLLHTCIATSIEMLDTVVEGFAKKGVMPMIEDAHSVAVASTVVRLIRFSSYIEPSARSTVMRKLTRVVVVCREAARGDQGSHPAYLARFIHALIDNADHSRHPSRAPTPSALPDQTLGSAFLPLSSQSISPENWLDDLNNIVTQEPALLLEEQQTFWDGFPILAGAMNTAPLIPDWESLLQIDQGRNEWATNEHWNVQSLGLQQNAQL
ncbi:hypothetical protein BD324DRAFT_637509 [Kockovaella imperatae]|uniref:Zn(2)-C6 fungal-type domain-containing protein n=1 Tax=Kockovaella imperatae TaxID=4999 RepID=A0A1Y1U9X8_9TREE|nr:hypothetical protein BD324DRAFT_637509 [Kockovaella imperatae]ORX34316.1 hypothetical protein BD324DRAFT_637509 [Kockovaella imperatae]